MYSNPLNPHPSFSNDVLFIIFQFSGMVHTYNDYCLFKLGFDDRKIRKKIKQYVIKTMHTNSDETFIQSITYIGTCHFSKRIAKRIGYFLTTLRFLFDSNYYNENQRNAYIHTDIDWERNTFMNHRCMTIIQCLIREPWQNFTKEIFEKFYSLNM